MRKLEKLKKVLSQMRSLVLAYSGGVDSTFLLKVAGDCLGKRLVAVTAYSPTYTRRELALARDLAKSFGVKHRIIHTDEFKDKNLSLIPEIAVIIARKNSSGA